MANKTEPFTNGRSVLSPSQNQQRHYPAGARKSKTNKANHSTLSKIRFVLGLKNMATSIS
jgi:hypothetical protein